ncbi:MAG TPA: fibronectin type III domain-containing protein, partial [Salinivirgaceae bacterium]|nr:fibronectin type III domain-containing protein [Salinivirgaceae bacterium]
YSLTIIPINRVGFITATNNYYTSGNVSSITFRLAPTSQASNIVLQDFSGGTATIAWTSGNGNGRVLKMNTTNNFTAPTLGSYPTANSTWQNAGEQVVYNGNGNSATISGLSSNQTYWFRLYELNNPESGRALYNTQSATNNPTSLTTISAPSTQDYQISFSNLFTNQVTVSWTKGDGDYRIVVMNSTNSFTNPSNNTTYTTDDSWNNAGEQVVYNSSGNSVVVTNLQANNTYYFRVFAYNGTAGNEIYNLQTATNNPNSVSTSTNLTWTGQTSTDWSNANNWNPPMAPTNQHSVHIPIVSSQNYPIINSSVSVKNITIAPQAELTVSNGVTLSVVENFVIQGTSAGSGSLLVEGTGTVSVGQTSKFVRHTGSNNYWHFASTPTNNSDIKQFTGHYVNQWNETTQSWTQLNSSSSLQVMRGYSIKQYNRDTTVFTGNFNNGLKSIAVTNSGSGSYPGLNIIGNPYPSAIDWKSPNGWTRNYIDPTIYVYHTQSQTYYTYNYQTNVASPASFDGIVPAGNGYYIIAQQNTTLSTTNDVRVHSSQSFYKNQTSPQWPLIRFNATNDKNMDELVIFFHPEAPEKITYDCRFSAIKLFPEEMQEKPYIYAKTNTETYPNLAVVALNEKLLNRLAAGETIDIPVTIGSRTTKQAVTITEENIQNDYSYSLYNPFSKKEDLLFSHTEVESGDYILRIKQKSTTLNINESLTNNDAFILVRDNKIYVTNNQNINNSIIVTDISGRMIENGTVGAYETIVIDMNQKSGMFVVTILNSKRLITKKVLIP